MKRPSRGVVFSVQGEPAVNSNNTDLVVAAVQRALYKMPRVAAVGSLWFLANLLRAVMVLVIGTPGTPV